MFRVTLTTIVVYVVVMLPTVTVSQELTTPCDCSNLILSDGQGDPSLQGPSTEWSVSDLSTRTRCAYPLGEQYKF